MYHFYSRRVKILVRDIRGTTRSITDVARFVLSWNTSPLVLANRNRKGFVGRDLMLRMRARITLDPVARSSAIEFI